MFVCHKNCLGIARNHDLKKKIEMYNVFYVFISRYIKFIEQQLL